MNAPANRQIPFIERPHFPFEDYPRSLNHKYDIQQGRVDRPSKGSLFKTPRSKRGRLTERFNLD